MPIREFVVYETRCQKVLYRVDVPEGASDADVHDMVERGETAEEREMGSYSVSDRTIDYEVVSG